MTREETSGGVDERENVEETVDICCYWWPQRRLFISLQRCECTLICVKLFYSHSTLQKQHKVVGKILRKLSIRKQMLHSFLSLRHTDFAQSLRTGAVPGCLARSPTRGANSHAVLSWMISCPIFLDLSTRGRRTFKADEMRVGGGSGQMVGGGDPSWGLLTPEGREGLVKGCLDR